MCGPGLPSPGSLRRTPTGPFFFMSPKTTAACGPLPSLSFGSIGLNFTWSGGTSTICLLLAAQTPALNPPSAAQTAAAAETHVRIFIDAPRE